ncbi:MAG: T9SS type A sorting domain-containing protein [Bacteroidia bacterium]|nr:T9SS type A sorting domain-containing protein [Bacteroidia bacterium]
MKKILFTALLIAFGMTSLQAQLVSFSKIKSFTTTQIDSIAAGLGVPSFIFSAEYPVDFYTLVYKTPYKTMNNMVNVTAGLAIPAIPDCDIPLTAYAHGTSARRHEGASTLSGGEWDVNVMFASTGYMIVMPDGLGLGESDTSVIIHPYIHKFSQSHTTINSLRAARVIADSVGSKLNGQVFLYGYSQGGFTTAATARVIEEDYASEFNLAGVAPMSGPYDLKHAQVDLMISDSVYPTPGYFPYVVLSYQSMYGNLYNTLDEVFKTPYDSTMPIYFYGGNYGMGFINSKCPSVPKHIALDTVVTQFTNDSLHPLRVALADNHLIDGWIPQCPMKLFYCNGDDQVSYLNSENAYNSWTSWGAPHLEKEDLGAYNHSDCATFAFLNGKSWFDARKQDCTVLGTRGWGDKGSWEIFPNPASQQVTCRWEGSQTFLGQAILLDLTGKVVSVIRSGEFAASGEISYSLAGLQTGLYLLQVKSDTGELKFCRKLLVE